MGGSSPSNQPTFGLSKLMSSSSLGPVYSGRVALSLDEGCTALSTAVIGTTITLGAFYMAGIHNQARPCYEQSSNVFKWFDCLLAPPSPQSPTLFKWLDSSVDYIPPKMDLFSDVNPPFGSTSSSACPVDSEHLERSFDLLRYQYAVKHIGVPTVVDHNIRIVTLPTGLQSHDGISTDTQFSRADSTSPGDSPDPFVDQPRRSRSGGSNNGAASGGDDGGSVRAGGGPTRHKLSAQHAYKLDRFGSPPPPPPPPGSSDAEDDDYRPRSSGPVWGAVWKVILLGAAIGLLLSKFFPNREQSFRRVFRAAFRLEPSQPPSANRVHVFGVEESSDVELESAITALPVFVDEVSDVNRNHTNHQPTKTSPAHTATLPDDNFWRQLLTFAAGTGKAFAVLFLLVSCAVLRTIITTIVRGIFYLTATTVEEASTSVFRDDQSELTVVSADIEVPVEASAPVEDLGLDVDVFGNAWLWANDGSQAIDTSVEDSVSDATATFENFWVTESRNSVEALAPVKDFGSEATFSDNDSFQTAASQASDSDSAFSGDNSFWSTESQALVEEAPAFALSDSDYSHAELEDRISPSKVHVEAPAPESDSFKWDSSFQCSTPLSEATGNFDYGREFFGGLGISASDPHIVDSNTSIDVPSIAEDALQELEITKRNLNTIIEAQIKRAESSYGKTPHFNSHLQQQNMNRSLSSSIWASTPGPSSGSQGDRFTPSSSSRRTVETRPLPIDNIMPSEPQIETTNKTPQQAPGRRRRHRPRGRNRGRGPSYEEEEDSSDVPDWANV